MITTYIFNVLEPRGLLSFPHSFIDECISSLSLRRKVGSFGFGWVWLVIRWCWYFLLVFNDLIDVRHSTHSEEERLLLHFGETRVKSRHWQLLMVRVLVRRGSWHCLLFDYFVHVRDFVFSPSFETQVRFDCWVVLRKSVAFDSEGSLILASHESFGTQMLSFYSMRSSFRNFEDQKKYVSESMQSLNNLESFILTFSRLKCRRSIDFNRGSVYV